MPSEIKCPNCGNKEYSSVTMAVFKSCGNTVISRDPIEMCICEKCCIMFANPVHFVRSIKHGQ